MYLAVIFFVVMAFQLVFNQATQPEELTWSEFTVTLESGGVEGEVLMKDKSNELTGAATIDGTLSGFIVR